MMMMNNWQRYGQKLGSAFLWPTMYINTIRRMCACWHLPGFQDLSSRLLWVPSVILTLHGICRRPHRHAFTVSTVYLCTSFHVGTDFINPIAVCLAYNQYFVNTPNHRHFSTLLGAVTAVKKWSDNMMIISRPICYFPKFPSATLN